MRVSVRRLPALLLLCGCPREPEGDAGPCAAAAMPAIDVAGAVAGTREEGVSYDVPWTGEARGITVHAWYPTDETSGTPAKWLGLFDDPGSLVGATLALPDETCKAPLVVYSHGSQAWAGTRRRSCASSSRRVGSRWRPITPTTR